MVQVHLDLSEAWEHLVGVCLRLEPRLARMQRRRVAAVPKHDCRTGLRDQLFQTARDRRVVVDAEVVGDPFFLYLAFTTPHADNEQAADYLRTTVGRSNPAMTWVVVRPDSLRNEDDVTDYSIHTSPTRSAIFNPGSTSRINVAHFMLGLITNDHLWDNWEGQMPVIYNQ